MAIAQGSETKIPVHCEWTCEMRWSFLWKGCQMSRMDLRGAEWISEELNGSQRSSINLRMLTGTFKLPMHFRRDPRLAMGGTDRQSRRCSGIQLLPSQTIGDIRLPGVALRMSPFQQFPRFHLCPRKHTQPDQQQGLAGSSQVSFCLVAVAAAEMDQVSDWKFGCGPSSHLVHINITVAMSLKTRMSPCIYTCHLPNKNCLSSPGSEKSNKLLQYITR
ncbi:uncharacterized protein LOC121140916 [Mesocricetus auratus]|uniref:Uncharacterized protein LOC121140916 n=1 Tax=Mesocricetus auratus TaxID=10036 RepID=A0ABM2XR43_MESAU|nr:uncharacterized protein LOC121140916 [Mesocricetus auratus]XP_040603568.1 uncharacterized protein LOC121140916 [Mesocricetus auratus]